MDTRSLIAIVLSILILIVSQEILSYLYPPPPRNVPTQSTESPLPAVTPAPRPSPEKGAEGQIAVAAPAGEKALISGRDITVENDVYTAVFTSLGGRLKSLSLKHYPGDAGRESPPLEMVKEGPFGELPLVFALEGKDLTISDEAVPYEVSNDHLRVYDNEQGTVEFSGKTSNGTLITKTLSFSGQTYGITLTVKVEGALENVSFASLRWSHALEHYTTSRYQVHGPVALIDRKFMYEALTSIEGKEQTFGPDRIRWGGYADTYFVAALIPPEGDMNRLSLSALNGTVETKVIIPWKREPVTYTVYVGPKEFEALNAVSPALDRAIDFGWFHFIARPLVWLLKFSHSLTGNYGIDIILLTVLVKLAFFPLSNKSFKSMAKMREVQPQMERLREQYKDDKEKLNQEMMELYRRYKINPLGGCLPMVVQMPVFIGLYQALGHAIELRQAPFFGWIQDLSQPDRLGTLNLMFIEPPGIPVLTALMGVTMLLQQAMTPATGDPTQQKMMMFMPLIFTVMFVNFPAGLVLYWLVNNVLSIAQQYAYNKGLV
ncbi:MAG: membrane protein insertase YidC [Deltaproteobacteria bacterium]|nr:membrane protein insertase YidC [Deltaproteobacteria bacterium]